MSVGSITSHASSITTANGPAERNASWRLASAHNCRANYSSVSERVSSRLSKLFTSGVQIVVCDDFVQTFAQMTDDAY